MDSDTKAPTDDAKSTEDRPDETASKGISSPHLWVASTYFAEGFPYTVVNTLAEMLFKEAGASLKVIGLTSLFHLPWNIKFLWGPFVDVYGTRRTWLLWVEVAIVLVLLGLSVAAGGPNLGLASFLFVILAFLSATHDIAIDGFYLDGLDKKGQSKFVGYRATAYRIAQWVGTGVIVVAIGELGWSVGFLLCAALMGLLLAYHRVGLPLAGVAQRPFVQLFRDLLTPASLLRLVVLAAVIYGGKAFFGSALFSNAWKQVVAFWPALDKIGLAEWIAIVMLLLLSAGVANLGRIQRSLQKNESAYAAAFVDFLSQKHVGRILAFVVLFRIGESFLLKMRYAFLRDCGMTMEQFGVAGGTIGIVASFSATLLGGYLISRDGLQRWIWPFVMAQNALHLLYTWAAWSHGIDKPLGLPLLTTVIAVEAFGSGLGTAVLMVYIMRCCRPAYKAAHMAILTALMSLSFTFAGVFSGFLADWMGYPLYFAFTFVITLPAMALILYVPYLDGTTAADART